MSATHRTSRRSKAFSRGLMTALPKLRAMGADIGADTTAEDMAAYVARARPMLDRLAARGPVPPGTRVTPTSGAPTSGEWVSTATSDPTLVVMHLHGGAYCLCSPATHRGLARGLSKTSGARVLLPSYRLAPEHPFPAALDDAVANYRWLVHDRGADPARIVVSGDSAGGGLSLAMLVRLRDEGEVLPAGWIGMSPWTDLAATGESHVSNATRDSLFGSVPEGGAKLLASLYHGDTDPRHPLVSPLYADLTGLPPMIVHVGEDELIRDDGVRVVERARAAGVDASLGRFTGMWHAFQAFPVPEATRSLREFGGFVRRVTGRL